jgi:predicted dehydrogenase
VIDAAIVGLGWWGRHIVGSLQGKNDRIRFVRAIDISPDRARGFADQHGLLLSSDYQDALDDDSVDAVVLATPHSWHEAQTVRAAAAGKHVFTEKPLALSKEGAVRAIAACEQAGVVLGIGHERRFEPALLEIKDLVDGNELGTIMHIEANFSHDGLAAVKADDWRASKIESPAAAMTSMGIHLTDSFIHMLGPVSEVHAMTAKRMTASESGDVVSAHMRFESGATGSFSSILATPFFMRFHVFGSDGWAEARDTVRPEREGVSILATRLKGADVQIREVISIDTVRANIEAFAGAAGGGLPYPVATDEMAHNIAVLEAIVDSAESGKPVAVT